MHNLRIFIIMYSSPITLEVSLRGRGSMLYLQDCVFAVVKTFNSMEKSWKYPDDLYMSAKFRAVNTNLNNFACCPHHFTVL